MEKTDCKLICVAPTTLAVTGLMMMMMMMKTVVSSYCASGFVVMISPAPTDPAAAHQPTLHRLSERMQGEIAAVLWRKMHVGGNVPIFLS